MRIMASMAYMPCCPTIQGFSPASIGIRPFGREMRYRECSEFFQGIRR